MRFISLAFGLAVFIWLSPEDNTVWPAVVLGTGLALLSVAWFIHRRLEGYRLRRRDVLLGMILLGGVVGLGGALGSAGLMFFKNALHAHVFWDFPPAMVAAMLTRAPSWALAGALTGLGAGLLWIRRGMITKPLQENMDE